MNWGIEIAGEPITQLAARMGIHGEDYAAALQRLKDRGYGCGSWGDNTGLFAALYAEYGSCGALAVETLSRLSGVMSDTGDGLRTANSRIADANAMAAAETERLTSPYQV